MRSTAAAERALLSKHRIEGLTDGIFAVAMTLLVIELRVPAHADVHDPGALVQGVVNLTPKFIAWIISFMVLAIFWFNHTRLFHNVQAVDGPLVWLSILDLGFASLLPFSSALAGEYARMWFSQVFYSTNLVLLGAAALLMYRHVRRHPELWATAVTAGFYRAARFRILGLMVIAVVAIAIAARVPGLGNVAFALMIPITILSRRIERRVTSARV
jgi:uncharacterized membrane protein